eukprot:760327-Hanusia_phi.AAC.10
MHEEESRRRSFRSPGASVNHGPKLGPMDNNGRHMHHDAVGSTPGGCSRDVVSLDTLGVCCKRSFARRFHQHFDTSSHRRHGHESNLAADREDLEHLRKHKSDRHDLIASASTAPSSDPTNSLRPRNFS